MRSPSELKELRSGDAHRKQHEADGVASSYATTSGFPNSVRLGCTNPD